MKVRPILTFGLAAGLVLLLTAGPGRALAGAAQPRTAVTASDPVRVAVPLQHMDGDRNVHLAPSAPCEVSGLIATDTTWGPGLCDPYVVTGNVSVQSGATLTIQAGTMVKFNSLTALAVAGTLLACGTEANRITFTSNQSSPAAGDWAYIYFANSSTDASADRDCSGHGSGSIIQYAIIEYAGGANVSNNGALRIESSSPLVDHNIVRYNDDDGIYFWYNDASPRVTNNTVTGNSGDGIEVGYWSRTAIVSGNIVTGNSYLGIYVNERATISGNTITGNSHGGIYVDCAATISGNTISNNSASYGGGIYVAYGGTASISNNTITSNTATMANQGGGIYLYDGSRPIINNNDLYGNVTGTPANVPNDLYNGNEYGQPDVDAENNDWGTTDPAVIEDHIWHFMDDPSLGVVSYGYDLSPSVPCTALGLIATDTTWGPGLCDPYVVTGNVSVQSGATLTIQPGTTVKFDSLKALAIAGTLVACGTGASPITLTSNRPSPAAGDWAYIYFANSSTDASLDRDCSGHGSGSIIQYAIIEYAGGANVSNNGALRIESASPLVDHNIVRYSDDDGIYFWENNASPRVTNNTVTGNSGDGIEVGYWSRTAIVSGNIVTGNSYFGIYVSERATISGNTITGNSHGGIYVDCAATISGNTISNNSASYGGGIHVAYGGSGTITCNTITSNTARYANYGGGIYLNDNGRPTINDNDLYGNLTGDPANVPNDLYNGNTYGGLAVDATNNYWGTTDPAVIEGHIWHFPDSVTPLLGDVTYTPFRTSPVLLCMPTSILSRSQLTVLP